MGTTKTGWGGTVVACESTNRMGSDGMQNIWGWVVTGAYNEMMNRV